MKNMILFIAVMISTFPLFGSVPSSTPTVSTGPAAPRTPPSQSTKNKKNTPPNQKELYRAAKKAGRPANA